MSPYGVVGETAARSYYESLFGNRSSLTVDNGQTQPGVFPDPKIGSYPPGAVLQYCIDRPAMNAIADRFDLPGNPDIYALVDIAFASAAAAWNTVAGEYSSASGLSIQHALGRDDSCSARPNDNITWYVTTTLQPVQQGAGLEYMTFALGPKYFAGSATGGNLELRYFLLNDYIVQSFLAGAFEFQGQPNWASIFSLNGLMLHAIGSGLGFVREDLRGSVAGDGGQAYWPDECVAHAQAATWDVVVVDAYDAADLAAGLVDRAFFAALERVLREGGTFAFNLIASLDGAGSLGAVIAAARCKFSDVRVVPVLTPNQPVIPSHLRNVVVMGTKPD